MTLIPGLVVWIFRHPRRGWRLVKVLSRAFRQILIPRRRRHRLAGTLVLYGIVVGGPIALGLVLLFIGLRRVSRRRHSGAGRLQDASGAVAAT